MTRHNNHGLRKVCGCSRRAWAKCEHPWHMNFSWKGTHYRLSLERALGRKVKKKEDARDAAETLRKAIKAGEWPLKPAADATTPEAVTFAKMDELWIERAREHVVTDWKSDRSRSPACQR